MIWFAVNLIWFAVGPRPRSRAPPFVCLGLPICFATVLRNSQLTCQGNMEHETASEMIVFVTQLRWLQGKAESEHWFELEEGVAVSKSSCIACICPVWRDQQKAATLQESGGFCRFVRRSEHPTGNFYLLLTRYLCRRFAYFKLGAHFLDLRRLLFQLRNHGLHFAS